MIDEAISSSIGAACPEDVLAMLSALVVGITDLWEERVQPITSKVTLMRP